MTIQMLLSRPCARDRHKIAASLLSQYRLPPPLAQEVTSLRLENARAGASSPPLDFDSVTAQVVESFASRLGYTHRLAVAEGPRERAAPGST